VAHPQLRPSNPFYTSCLLQLASSPPITLAWARHKPTTKSTKNKKISSKKAPPAAKAVQLTISRLLRLQTRSFLYPLLTEFLDSPYQISKTIYSSYELNPFHTYELLAEQLYCSALAENIDPRLFLSSGPLRRGPIYFILGIACTTPVFEIFQLDLISSFLPRSPANIISLTRA
jgi:hypothetical protein